MRTAFVATLSLLVVASESSQAQSRSPLNELDLNRRPTAGRLVGLDYLEYSPEVAITRNAAAEARLLAPLEQTSSAANDDWRAQFMLLAGRPERAVAMIEDVLAEPRPDLDARSLARLWNDLAVARLEAAVSSDAPGELVAAFEAVAQSIASDPGLAEARFNRALILETLGLNEAARVAWSAVVAGEVSSGWGEDATGHLRSLERIQASDWAASRDTVRTELESTQPERTRELVSLFPQEMQELAMNELLTDWAEATFDGRPRNAATALEAAASVGQAAEEVKSDAFVSDIVAHIRSLEAESRSEALGAVVEGHRAYARGLERYNRADRGAAEADFRAAHELLAGASSPFALYAELQIARCASIDSRYEEALAWLARVTREAGEDRYPHLIGRVLWIQGYVQLDRIQPMAALEPLVRSYDIFARIGERENAVAVGILLAQSTDALGDASATWRHYTRAMQAVGRGLAPRRPRQLFAIAAQTAARQGLPLTSLELHAEAVRLSREMASPLAIAESHWWRGETLFGLRRFEEARADLAEARAQALRIEGSEMRDRTLAGVRVLEGEILAETEPEAAITALDGSLRAFANRGFGWFLPRAYSARARAYAALGDLDRSERDVLSGIQEVESQAASITDPARRNSFEQAARDLYDQMVVLQMIRRGAPDRAFAFAERAKHRKRRTETLETRTIVARLPRDTVVVEYHIARESVFAWTASSLGIEGLTLEVTPAEVDEETSRFRAALRGDGEPERLAESSRALYRSLLAPIAAALGGARRVVIAPDGPLSDIPFAALQDPETGRYFVESYPSTVAPSATLYLSLLDRAAELPVGKPVNTLLVADPSFDRALFPRLPALPGARTAALALATIYPSSRLFEGPQATKANFLDHVAAAEVVHFGGHAIVGSGDRAFARLLFAPGDRESDDGVLYAHELESLGLDRARLVVLSACETAVSASGESEGAVESLAQVFLSRRVPDVAASLWAVDDLITSEFFVRFHRNFVETGSAVTALRQTQLEFLRGENVSLADVRTWAPFVLMGA